MVAKRPPGLLIPLTALLWWSAGQSPGWFALGWVALLPLLWGLAGLGARQRLRLGYLAGFLCYALHNWWIAPTIARAGAVIGLSVPMGAALGVASVVLIAAIHGLQVALVSLAWSVDGRLSRAAAWALPVAIAVLWAGCDILRCETELAHAWGALAYGQWRDVYLLQVAPLIGQHGISALCVWFAACTALWLSKDPVSSPAYLWQLPVGAFLLLHCWGAWRVSDAPAPGRELRVLLIQTAVPGLRKAVDGPAESPLQQAGRLSLSNARRRQFDLVVWPETTATIRRDGAGRADPSGQDFSRIKRLAAALETPILTGAHSVSRDRQFYNEALLVTPQGEEHSSTKQRLSARPAKTARRHLKTAFETDHAAQREALSGSR